MDALNVSGIQKPYAVAEAFASFLKLDAARKVKRTKDADARFLDIARHFIEVECLKTDLADVTLEDLQSFELWMGIGQKIGKDVFKEPWSQTTIHLRSRIIKAIFRKAYLTKKIPWNPAELWRVPRGTSEKRRPMSNDEFHRVFALAPDWFRPALRFLQLTGARGASAADLIWDDVDFSNRRIRIRSRKGGTNQLKEIYLPLYPALFELLERERKKTFGLGRPSRTTDPVFWGPKGLPITAQEIASHGSKLIKRAGLKGVVLYGLRHAMASELTAAGVPLEVVRQALGHTKLEQTAHYASGISLGVVGDALNKVREIETPQSDDDPPDL